MLDGSTIADPDVQVPAAVRRAAERAEQLAAEATAEARRNAGLEETPAESPPGEGAPTEGAQAGEVPDDTTTVVTDPPPAPAPPAEPVRDAAYWERRCRSIQGKYDTEVPHLAAQLRGAQARVTELEGHVADLNMRRRAAPAAKPKPDISPEDEETYGRDFIDKVRNWVGTPADDTGEIAQLKEQVQQLQQRTVQTQQQSAQDTVKFYLNSQLPQWERINTEPDFYDAWLQQPDPFSGIRRMELLQQAYTNGDGPRTLQFFKAYLAEHTAIRPAEIPPAHTPDGAGTVPLEGLAAPGRGRPGVPGAPAEKPMFTSKQIETFYRDVTRGAYRNSVAEKDRIERQIHEAAAEGRIRQ